jgi:hypothetical protein
MSDHIRGSFGHQSNQRQSPVGEVVCQNCEWEIPELGQRMGTHSRAVENERRKFAINMVRFSRFVNVDRVDPYELCRFVRSYRKISSTLDVVFPRRMEMSPVRLTVIMVAFIGGHSQGSRPWAPVHP